MTHEQTMKLRTAIYAIADAAQVIEEVRSEMTKNKQWAEVGDVGRLSSQLDDLIREGAMHYFLKNL